MFKFKTFFLFLFSKKYRPLIMAVMFLLVSSTLVFHLLEDMSWLDAVYFSVVTLATVGYGDIVPKTDIGKIFCIIYIISGIGLFFGFIQAYFDFIKEHYSQKKEKDNS